MIIYDHATNKNNVYLSNNKLIYTFLYPCTSHSTCSPYKINVTRGYYYLEVFGSQGSNGTDHNKFAAGGKGGYSAGVFHANSFSTLYLFIGASTNSTISRNGGYNGGGNGASTQDGSGGGATDFRLNGEALSSRIIVAGGGGGGYTNSDYSLEGGAGGGLYGEPGKSTYGVQPCVGSQSSCVNGQYSETFTHFEGRLGFGSGGYCGSGGGGYYGGGNTASGGGGGSGYIGGVFGNNRYKRVTKAGINPGFGYAKITLIGLACHETIHYSFTHKVFILLMTLLVSS